ncbi:hypothetical protein GLOTRDRAFT_141458 [Gloeophyllum trabeum ATCC 11539]|uniref:Rap1 Myb domain-containing protein n=1 Tax=Gloeophyllum trabeum (strain ATCC 11539 / FP-39264 / Madison 617) TaxID=670483 RepID=S7R8Q8_GLOTA|nr:uncharacterized protein GLOTRDRAFT_141458 [Gloeophyllum trabeum ATCC 11539]EPQ50705.1 hypothetical protein GLOTRDRAFT_141458 [Gloeophyllum trabeum ATCC 11539]
MALSNTYRRAWQILVDSSERLEVTLTSSHSDSAKQHRHSRDQRVLLSPSVVTFPIPTTLASIALRVEDAMARSVHRHNSPADDVDDELDAGNVNEVEDERVFVQDGKPIYFYLHRLTAAQVRALYKKITDADVLLCPPERVGMLRRRYWMDVDPEVVDVGFVDVCIRRGEYAHAPPVRKGMGGPRPGQGRVEFSDADKVNLARYLAKVVPDRKAGGRLGRIVYERLMERGEWDPAYAWAKRHTWESWKQHYKMNREWFDERIKTIVRLHPPRKDGKGQYELDRRRKRGRVFISELEGTDEDEDEEEGEGEEEEEEEAVEKQVGRRRPRDEDEERESMRPPPAKRMRRASESVTSPASEVEGARGAPARTESKGKGKPRPDEEEEEDDDDVDIDDIDMFNPNGYYDPAEDLPLAGPSGTQHSPGAGMSSQATLVGPVPTQLRREPSSGKVSFGTQPVALGQAVRRSAPYRLQSVATSSSPERQDSQARGQPDEAGENAGGSPADEDVPPHELADEDVDVVPPTEGEDPELEEEIAPLPAPRPKARRAVKKTLSQATYDGPARNTRARSRSVDPTPPAPPAKRVIRGRKGKEAGTRGGPATRSRQADLADIQEASSDEDIISLEEEGPDEASGVPQAGASARSRGSIGETQEEEEVEKAVDALSAATAESGASSIWKRLLHEDRKDYQPGSGQRRSVSKHPFDSDDQETIRDLARSTRRSGGRDSIEDLTNEQLADNLEQLLSPLGSAQSMRRAASTSSWATSESGEGSRNFPPPGTRARVAKEALERTPYRPPRGTKAEEFAKRV